MTGMLIFILIDLVIVGLVVLAIYYFNKQRQKAMAYVAIRLGLDYQAADSGAMGDGYVDISIFNHGDSRRASNIISGRKDGLRVDMFDYRYTTGSGKNRQTHNFSVGILTVAQQFKNLLIRPEGFFDKIAGAIGFDDIDFESKEFSSRFWVKSADKKFAYDIIHPQMMDFLLRYAKPPIIEINGPYLVFYFKGKIPPEKYIELYEFGKDFYNKTPNYVRQEYGALSAR